ncbi:enoyl-CoA hydratase/isomerase family protein, partial [Candidatus Sumerlaeota bacterium]|nr:enoyl-CoA hydratase/isomerase family protein [Candidatus Sumerlaeota bacterium]
MGETVIVSTEGSIASVLLNQPDRRNVLSVEMVNDLNAALESVAKDSSARIAILRAEGPAFCAGMDLKKVALDDPPQASTFAEALAEAYRKLLLLPMPLLSAVDGPAMGGAVGLALAADLVWVGPNARFAFHETRVGVVPALVSVIARRRIAPGKLRGLGITGIELHPADAVRIGLADFQAGDSASADAEAFARKLLKENSTEAMRRTKLFFQSQF